MLINTKDWLTNDVLNSKIEALKALLICSSCGNQLSSPVYADNMHEIYCQFCVTLESPAKINKTWDHFVHLLQNLPNSVCNDTFNGKKDQKTYDNKRISRLPSKDQPSVPYSGEDLPQSNNIECSLQNPPDLQLVNDVDDRLDESLNILTQSDFKPELGHEKMTTKMNSRTIKKPLPSNKCLSISDNHLLVLAKEKIQDSSKILEDDDNNAKRYVCDDNTQNEIIPLNLNSIAMAEINSSVAMDDANSGVKLTNSSACMLGNPASTVNSQKRKHADSFQTPKPQRIALDDSQLIRVLDNNGTDCSDGDEIIQLSRKDLKILLETAKKKARVEFEEYIQTTAKKVPIVESAIEEGIVPLEDDMKKADTVAESCSLRERCDETFTSSPLNSVQVESDSDNFVPPTPPSKVNMTLTSVIGTGLSASHKETIAKSLEQFGFTFSSQLTCVDYLIAGQEQVTIKWLFARVNGIPIVSINWLEMSLKSKRLMPLDAFILEKPYTISVPEIFASLDIALCSPFSKYSQHDLTILLEATGASVKSLECWTPSANTLRMIVGDNACIGHTESQLIGLSAKFRAAVVDISYLLAVLESGRVRYLQPNLLINVSDQILARLGFPREMLTPDDDEY